MILVHETYGWFETCDKQFFLSAGTTTTIPQPSGYYSAGSSCRYQIQAPQGFTITATCNLQIYKVCFLSYVERISEWFYSPFYAYRTKIVTAPMNIFMS